jgi:HAE1 family hydrophobic/amphiphilic exporter-1
MWFIKLCIERPVFIVMVEALLMILGVIGFSNIGIDLYPKIDPPVVTVSTEYSGAGPEEIETLISKKIEEEVNQIGGIKRIQSVSQQNLSRVTVEFELEIDAQSAQNDVRDKVLRIRNQLPTDIEEPRIERMNFEDRPIVNVALTPDNDQIAQQYSNAVLRIIADDQVKPQLQKINGVGQVNLFGGQEREVQVLIDRQRLQSYNLSIRNVRDALTAGNINTPSGEVDEMPYRRSIRVMGEFANVGEIQDVIVATLKSGKVVKISDLAQVVDGLKEQTTLARVNGQPVIILEIKKQSDANTVEVAENVLNQLTSLNTSLPQGLRVEKVYDGSQFIKMSVYDVIETIGIAAILAIIVVYCFLGSIQSTLITGLALPCTIVATFFVLNATGFTLNMMTLLGLTLSVGLILDDAIVVRENIWAKIEQGMDAKKASFEGTREVVIAVLATSLTVLAVFFPVTFISGMVGRFLAAFAMTVCVGIVLSTFDALTMAPMLSANLMRSEGPPKKPNVVLQILENFGGWVSKKYERILKLSLGRPWATLLVSAVIFVLSITAMKQVGFTFLPEDESGELRVRLEGPPGTSFTKMEQIAVKAENIIKTATPEQQLISTQVGNDVGETNKSTIYVRLSHYSERTRTTSDVKNDLRRKLRPLIEAEGLTAGIGNASGGGGGKPISLVIQGRDNKVLQDIAYAAIDAAQEQVPGAVNLETNLKPGRQELQMIVDRQNAAAFGLRVQEIGENVRGLYEGLLAGVYRENGEEYDIRVRLSPDQRSDLLALQDFTLPNDRGDAVPLNAVVRTRTDSSPTSIVRIDQQRSARIEGDIMPGQPLAEIIDSLTAVVNPLLPVGYRMKFQGQAEALKDLAVGALIALVLGAVFIYMVMASLYESFVIPFAILMTLPLAIIGAILALLFSGKFIDIYGIIGIILLMALVTKNGILLIDYVEQLRAQGKPRHQALVEGGLRRMRPIVMTTIAMIAGMLPVAIGYGEVNKVRAGMGITAIGGLISSTALSLVVIPCVYIYLDDFRNFAGRLLRQYYFKSDLKTDKAPS